MKRRRSRSRSTERTLLEDAQLGAIQDSVLPTLIANAVLGPALAVGSLGGTMRVGWLGVLFALNVWSLVIARQARGAAIDFQRVRAHFRSARVASAIAWAFAITWVLTRDGWPTAVYTLVLAAGIAASAASAYFADPLLVRGFLLALLAPPVVGTLAMRSKAGLLIATAVVLYGLFMATLSRAQYKRLVAHGRDLLRLEEQNVALEERSRELRRAEKAARDASARADAANRAKTAFLAAISHDLRTPLTAVLGYAELLRTPKLSEEQRLVHATTIQQSGKHLLALLNQILDINKIEAGAMKLSLAPSHLPELLADIESLMRVRAEASGLRFEITLATPIPRLVTTDELRLRQILENLIGNAMKFTDRGSVDVVVALAENRLRFSICDTGIGMTPEQVSRLFGEYVQVDDSAARRFAGSGLGLNLSRKTARLFGGDIEVQSAPGVGSTFTLSIPAPGASGETTALIPSHHPASVLDRVGSLDGLRVLVADDTEAIRSLIKAFLEQAGARVDLARHGQDVVDLVTRGLHPDIVIMDMQMPVLDGMATVKSLRAAGHKMPILALTGRATQGDREECLAAGFDEWATKPIGRTSLIQTVDRLVGPRRLRSSKRPSEPIRSAFLDDPVVAAVLDEFYEELDSAVEKLRARTEVTTVAATAHVLAGAGGSFGFDALSVAALTVEDGLRKDPDLGRAEASIDDLLAVCEKVRRSRRRPSKAPKRADEGSIRP